MQVLLKAITQEAVEDHYRQGNDTEREYLSHQTGIVKKQTGIEKKQSGISKKQTGIVKKAKWNIKRANWNSTKANSNSKKQIGIANSKKPRTETFSIFHISCAIYFTIPV